MKKVFQEPMAYFKDRSEEFEGCSREGECYYEIFSEFGSTYVFAECDGFCHRCWQVFNCENSQEVEEWQMWLYS